MTGMMNRSIKVRQARYCHESTVEWTGIRYQARRKCFIFLLLGFGLP
jgi:hypothetical protein